jgi:hypothetical protein
MSSQTNHTITFFDHDAEQEAVVIVRNVGQKIGLCISLVHNGDLEIFLPVSEAKLVFDAIREAITNAET